LVGKGYIVALGEPRKNNEKATDKRSFRGSGNELIILPSARAFSIFSSF